MGVRIFRGGELDEKFVGSVVVLGPKPTHMSGLVRGDLFVRERSLCDITGFVTGMLLSEPTGKAVLRGMVAKDVKSSGGTVVAASPFSLRWLSGMRRRWSTPRTAGEGLGRL